MIGLYLALIDNDEDKIKFQEIYQSYRKQMWYTANDILQDNNLAEDAVHDAFLGIAKNFKQIKGFTEPIVKAYVITCARNAALKYIKRNKKINLINIDEIINLEDINASEEILETETVELVASILEKMPILYSEVLYLRVITGLTDKEIAFQLNRKESAVRQQIMRARRMFAALLKEALFSVEYTEEGEIKNDTAAI